MRPAIPTPSTPAKSVKKFYNYPFTHYVCGDRSLKIVEFPHPTLRHKSKPITRVDAQLKKIVSDMFELMYEAKGIGLAANQVDLPFQLFVVNDKGDREEGKEMVFINPVLSKPKGSEEAEEGCLSLPGLYGDVTRPKQIDVNAYNLQGQEINGTLTGLMARVVQHEFDHLQGIMFTDRMSETGQLSIQDGMQEFDEQFESQRSTGAIPSDEAIEERLADLEKQYCS